MPLPEDEEVEPEDIDERTIKRRMDLLLNGEKDGENRVIPWSCTNDQLADWIQNHSILRGRPKSIDALKTAFENFDGSSLLVYLVVMLLKKPTPNYFHDATQRLRRRLKDKPFQLNGAAILMAVKLLEEGAWLYFVAQWRRCAIAEMGSSITELRFVKSSAAAPLARSYSCSTKIPQSTWQ